MRFQRIDTDKELINHFIDKLKEIGYREVQNSTGGDEDFLMIDTFFKEFIWCENGFAPFCSDQEMLQYESYNQPETIDLKKLEKNRF
jgi:hypothetical protein